MQGSSINLPMKMTEMVMTQKWVEHTIRKPTSKYQQQKQQSDATKQPKHYCT